jgi:predicted ATPase
MVSSSKDGKKVINNTLDNISILINKLSENGVNICAITDHDMFSYEMYTALKLAEKESNSIEKVLPGVEFTVKFKYEGSSKVIHIVAIFSDLDEVKIKNIEIVLNKNRPDTDGAYSEESFLQILRSIDIDTILIAHQKNTLTSKKPRDNDANILGNKKFLEFVYTDYFEAFEFKNKRNEVLNKTFLNQEGLEEKLRFITGTDCHDWSAYPAEVPLDNIEEFPYTYAKCLPTFKGLVMAMTDHTRLKTVNSFFNNSDKSSIESIELESHKRSISIPMSKGINVVIGDNSVGKSMLLHALTGFNKSGIKLSTKVREGYKNYLKRNNLRIKTEIPVNQIFCFDMQGEVRTKFEENILNATEFLSHHFPSSIDAQPYKSVINNEIAKMINYLEKKFQLDALIKNLSAFSIVVSESDAESITFLKNLRNCKPKNARMRNITSGIDETLIQLNKLLGLSSDLDVEDVEFIKFTIDKFNEMKQKYDNKIKLINNESDRIEKIAKIIDKIGEEHRKSISDNQKRNSSFVTYTSTLKTQLIEIIKSRKELFVYQPSIEDIEIKPNSNKIFDYEFVSRLNIDRIGKDYLKSRVSKVIKANREINWETITESELQDILLRYDPNIPALQFFKSSLDNIIIEDFSQKNTIICEGTDKYTEMSSGLDAKIYFDILSYETTKDGIYIIDQPEDNISQSAIKTYLLDRFKTMGENRQIIMVSHNPQFIVNLDIDNLIFMTQKNGEIQVQSGALEYVSREYNVLDIVAHNIDGGLDTIQKRWKRYEKVTNV